ncbi:cell division protein FtsX [Sphingomonas sp. Leaf4]|uniref:cell division protein FtsX n=1 Tax=Sphingomonas sp. Leaf4 TaxID=2876553 RepID=UPI001E55E815|nr:FtsX-like permease family protein [Sphingomonas sp. Leaf4]
MSAATRAAQPLLDDAQGRRAMVWIMAIMIFLTTLAAALGLAMQGAGAALDRQLAARLTVQVIEGDAATRDRAVAALLPRLRAAPQVAAAVEVDRARLAQLLEPWLGEAGLDADLPMPAMIDVDLRQGDAATVAGVEALARGVAPNVRVDRHATWLAPVRAFVGLLGWTALGLVLVMASATAAVVLLAARAGLDTHRGTIDILHMLGSTDLQITRLFQRRIAHDTLTGGLIGVLSGGLVAAFLGSRLSSLESQLAGGVTLDIADWLAIVALPFVFTGLAMLAARFAVLRRLARVL